MAKPRGTRPYEKADRAQARESLKDLKRLDGKRKRHVFRKLLGALCLLAVGAFAILYYAFDVPNWQTLDIRKITNLKQTGALYDKDGNLVQKLISTQDRVVIPLSSLPSHVKNAFIAAEDIRFYRHRGFDPVRILGAVRANVKSGGYGEGASTITQQLIKLSHLSAEKTIARKLEEVYLAVMLERAATKDEILEMYLNYVYFGRGAYGVEAAARAYFGVGAAALSPAQAASLAASIKAPSVFALSADPTKNMERRAYILRTMADNDMLTEAEFEAALGEAVEPVARAEEPAQYGWYADAAMEEAEKLLGITAEELLGSGYQLFTALDIEQQELIDAQFTVQSNFPANASDGTPVQGAMASVDISSGAVRAVVGGREYAVKRGLNRATQMRRQPGSAIKPLAVYAPAIESFGYHAASVLNDAPTKFGNYQPRNSGYAYYGFVTIRSALRSSLNVPAVALLDKIGVQAALQYLTDVGMNPDATDQNLSLALGSMTYGVSPVTLAAAYAPFGNGGYYFAPYFIERILDANGKTLFTRETTGKRVISETTAYIMTSLLQSVTNSGTGAKLSGAGTPVAGKTGTVNMTGGGNRDIWMAAYNSQISTAFWMGFDKADQRHKLASRVSGGDNTALVATNFFRSYYKGKDKPAFQSVRGVVWLEIDKKSIEWTGEAMLATKLTPKVYRYSEVFAAGRQPTRESNVWRAPNKPSSFYITHNNAGNPVLVITATDAALFRVQRDAIGESFILTELSGKAGETIYYADTKAKIGVEYTYRVTPINQELLNNGVLLEGGQSVRVTSAKSAGRTLFEDVSDLLFGGRTVETDDALSLFFDGTTP